MTKLSLNWFAEGLTDFEYKKYLLLAYLQHVHQNFEENKLYPELADLVQHYRGMTLFYESKNKLYNEFPKEMTGADFNQFRLVYEKTIHDDALMQEIERIVEYSIPRLKLALEDGRHRYDDIEHTLVLTPVGIEPLYKNEGYLFIKNGAKNETQVYQYRITLFEGSGERFKGINTELVAGYRNSIVYTYENIKRELVKNRKELPNPATYVAETNEYYPLKETLLPIAGRMLVRMAG